MRESSYNIWVSKDGAHALYNGMTGALLSVTRSERKDLEDFLARGPEARCSPDFLLRLAQGGMLVEEDTDELALLAERYRASRHNDANFALTIVSSLGCNFDCPYCYEKKHPEILGPSVRDALLEILDDKLEKIGAFAVTWFGGEPLVGKKPLFSLSEAFIEKCEAAGVWYGADIITNGYLLDGKMASDLKRLKISHAQVTLDGPADLHNETRPLAKGGGTFDRIVGNLREAVEHLTVSVRVNVDTRNAGRFEELLEALSDAGLSGRLGVYAAQIVGVPRNSAAPSAQYGTRCFTKSEFAEAELELNRLASRYGFSEPRLPRPAGTPCTAVRNSELVIGSKGELYKCWYDVGNSSEVVGHVTDYQNLNGRFHKWLSYDPFANPECRSCIALPVCMGGCAAHALYVETYDDRCGTFRHTYREQVSRFVSHATAKTPT